MIYELVHLNKKYNLKNDPTLEVIVPELLDEKIRYNRKSVLIIPGGGYDIVSKREGDPIAFEFMLKGYTCFILHYSVKQEGYDPKYPTPQLEVMASMDYIRKNSERFDIDINKITIMGFSAGGHLAASYGYLYKKDELCNLLNVEKENVKPNALCLAYPVITAINDTHLDTIRNITGNDQKLLKELSVELHIDNDYPKTFIWTTKDDNVVPSISTKLLDDALTKANVYHKTVIFKHGAHGLALGKEVGSPIYDVNKDMVNKEVQIWPELFDEFNKSIFS